MGQSVKSSNLPYQTWDTATRTIQSGQTNLAYPILSASGGSMLSILRDGTNTTLVTSTNGGSTWINHGVSTDIDAYAFVASGDFQTVLLLASGATRITHDGGATWHAGPVTGWGSSTAGMSRSGSHMVFIDSNSAAQLSTDGGQTFDLQCRPTEPLVRSRRAFGRWQTTGKFASPYYVTLSELGDRMMALDGQDHLEMFIETKATTTAGPLGGLRGFAQSSVELQYLGAGVFHVISYGGVVQPR